MMIIYNVTVNIDFDAHDEWLHWMKTIHIPEVMNTGMFLEARMSKILAEEDGGKSYAVQYLCENRETYERYRDEFAPALQQAHTARFGGRFVAFRTLLRVETHFIR